MTKLNQTFCGILAFSTLTAIAADKVEGPFKSNATSAIPDKGGIALEYKASSRTTEQWVKTGDYNVGVDVGIVGHGIEAYLSFTGQLVAVDRETKKPRWYHDIGAWYNSLSFIKIKKSEKGKGTALLCLGAKRGPSRFFDITSGQEKFLTKGKNGLQVHDEKVQELRGGELKVTIQLAGDNSKITERQCQRVTSDTEWQALWKRHTGSPAGLPEVNFKKHMVIAVFEGASTNSNGFKLLHALDCDDAIELFIQGDYYQTMNTANSVTPYGIFVIPRSGKKLLIKMNVQNYIGGPPLWHLMKEFEKL